MNFNDEQEQLISCRRWLQAQALFGTPEAITALRIIDALVPWIAPIQRAQNHTDPRLWGNDE